MFRNLSKPFDARILHARLGIEALRDGAVDERRPQFTEARNERLLALDERVDLACFLIQVGRQLTLLFERWESNFTLVDFLTINTRNS